ncbi:hypothetical protein Tco_1361064 [Tanacetum coccineum]
MLVHRPRHAIPGAVKSLSICLFLVLEAFLRLNEQRIAAIKWEVKESHESDVRHLEGLVHDVVKLWCEYEGLG